MKTPRVSDFDPNAKARQLKSSLDSMPAIGKPDKPPAPVPKPQEKRSPAVAPKPKTIAKEPAKRPYVRRTFDFYDDQIEYLKRESLQERLAGNDIGMNSMIREAIDDWIKKRSSRQ